MTNDQWVGLAIIALVYLVVLFVSFRNPKVVMRWFAGTCAIVALFVLVYYGLMLLTGVITTEVLP